VGKLKGGREESGEGRRESERVKEIHIIRDLQELARATFLITPLLLSLPPLFVVVASG
jgi:hypothetical protein